MNREVMLAQRAFAGRDADQSARRVCAWASLLLLGSVLSFPVLAVDDYEAALEAELQAELALEKKGQSGAAGEPSQATPAKSEPTVDAPASASEGTGDGASLEQFEKLLRDGFIGTYRVYQKLDEAGRKQVLQSYSQNHDMGAVRALVLKLYRSR